MNTKNTASQPKAASIGDDAQFKNLLFCYLNVGTTRQQHDVLEKIVAYLDSKLRAPADQAVSVAFQQRVQPWMTACFGAEISADKMERNHRFFEEATELVQAAGMTRSEAHQLVDYTYGRPIGELPQEVGGVMVTLAALCLAHGVDMHVAGEVELMRIWTKVAAIRAKQAAKPRHSPLPEAAPQQSLAPAASKVAIDHYGTTRCASCDANLDINEHHGDDCSVVAAEGQVSAAAPADDRALKEYALDEYQPGQWWLTELENHASHRVTSDDTRRAAGIALDFAAKVFASRASEGQAASTEVQGEDSARLDAAQLEVDATAFEAEIGEVPNRIITDKTPWGWRYRRAAIQDEFMEFRARASAETGGVKS